MEANYLRQWLESLVTKTDYFHLPHKAESDPSVPQTSYYYDVRSRLHYKGGFRGNLPVISYAGSEFINPIHVSQYGLAHLQHYWDTKQRTLLDDALVIAQELVEIAGQEGDALCWRYPLALHDQTGWLSAMAQGQVASFLLRIGSLTSDEILMKKGGAALAPFARTIDEGGVQTHLKGNIWFEEYAISPPPFTLNGFIVALLGLRDASLILENETFGSLYEAGYQTLLDTLPLFDLGHWSRYDLTRRRKFGLSFANLASPFYHRFHLELLKVMYRLTREQLFSDYLERWAQGLTTGPSMYRAVAEKSIYRLLTPSPMTKASS